MALFDRPGPTGAKNAPLVGASDALGLGEQLAQQQQAQVDELKKKREQQALGLSAMMGGNVSALLNLGV